MLIDISKEAALALVEAIAPLQATPELIEAAESLREGLGDASQEPETESLS